MGPLDDEKGVTTNYTPGGAQAFGYERPNDAVNTHCKKVNDFRDSKMLPSATPMKIIPEEVIDN